MTQSDSWTYKGRSVEFNPHGKRELFIDGEEIEPAELGSLLYDRETVKTYIDEKYETDDGVVTLDEHLDDGGDD